jgi:iron complex outermembrane receptor protein
MPDFRVICRALACLVVALLCARGHAQNVSDEGDLKSLSLEELMEVEVTSVSREPEKLFEAPASVEVLTGEEIRRSGATRLPEALRLAGNLDVAQKNSHDWGISARGFNTELANKLLVMIDGRTVYTPLFSGVVWDAQDVLLEDLERIEVVSGPGGSVWGANAVNGVISIVSKSARDTQGLYAEGDLGGVLQNSLGIRYGGRLTESSHYRVYAKTFERDREVLGSGEPSADSWNRRQAGFRFDADPSQRNSFTVQGDVYGGRDELAGGEDSVSGRNILARWTHTVSEDSALNLQAYYDHTHLQQPVPAFIVNGNALAPAGSFRDDLDTYDLDFQHSVRASTRTRLIWGLGYRHTRDDVGNAPGLGFFPSHLSQNLYSAFAQGEYSIRPGLSVTAGTKLEHNAYTGLEVEPSVRMQWARTPRQTLWAAASRAVRAPSRIDRDLVQPIPPYFTILRGGTEFQSETVIAYEAGWRMRFGLPADASVALFYNDYDDIRSTAPNPATVLPFSFYNDIEGHKYGAELAATYRVREGWILRGAWTLLRGELHVSAGHTDLNNALNETADPEHMVSARSSIDLPGRTALDVMARWIGDRPGHVGAAPATLESYYEADVRLGWQASDHLELSLIGRNLLHDQHAEYGFDAGTRTELQRDVIARLSWRY